MLKKQIRLTTIRWVFALVMILSAVSPVAAQKDEIDPDPNVAIGSIGIPGPKGDTNLDGFVTRADIITIIKHMLDKEELSPQGIRNADVNCDGRINMADVRLIHMRIQGAISSFPCPQ